MTKLYTIPKKLSSRIREQYYQVIPRIIWQTMKTNIVTKVMSDYATSWIDGNPEYEYRFFDDKDVYQFIKTAFPSYIKGYETIKYGAVKSDFWRYLIIYKYGGVYADIDCRCVVPLQKWINAESQWVTQLGVNRDVCQWLIISVPKNPVFKAAADKSYSNLINSRLDGFIEYSGFKLDRNKKLVVCERTAPVKIRHPVMNIAGPPILQKAAEECFRSKSNSGVFRSIQIVCVSGADSCQMNGNVQHEYGNREYLQGLQVLGTPHYESQHSHP
jgi:mannosyltransferase OCH1-like enzyme